MHRPHELVGEMIKPVHLIVGADSLVGGALLRSLQHARESVAGTTRRPANTDDYRIHLDLGGLLDNWNPPWPVSVATICAGITKAQACKDNPLSTAAINVQGICRLVAKLVSSGSFVIFLSTNQVFDGSVSFELAGAPLSPVTEYGRQKAEAEQQLARYGDSVAIVRFAKILGSRSPLIDGWIDLLKSGKPIHPFSDMTMAPVPLSCAVTVLSLIGRHRLSGIFQVSGQEDVSYAEAARAGAKALGFDQELVQPVAAAHLASYTESIPAHTTLNIDRLKSSLGMVPPSVSWTVHTAFANPVLLSGT
jgi:dTDP-4-dehydrorhamnose reductase